MIRGQTLFLLSAIAALLVLGWWSSRPIEKRLPASTGITLWTAGAEADRAVSSAVTHAALPGATAAPTGALRVGDAAELRRRLPHLTHIEIRGDGVDASNAIALRGLAVSWQRPNRPTVTPVLATVSTPPQVSVGQRVTVQGSIAGINPAGARVTLQSPDGTVESVELTAPTTATAVPFSISSSPARAPGEFEWRLRLEPGGESLRLGVSVKAPPSPRVLMIQASPHPELGRLQRWLTAAKAPVTTRTRVSADRFRFSAAPGALAEFDIIDEALLQQFDLIVATEGALAELEPKEEQALATAVRHDGLGLLVVGGVDPRTAGSPLLPWQLEATTTSDGDDRRLMRLQTAEGTEIAEWITLAAPELKSPPLAGTLVQDSRGRTLAAALRYGRGWLARSVLLDTWRWEQAGHGEAFSAYWAEVLSAIARTMRFNEGHWSLQAPGQPRLVNEPIELTWHGAENNVPAEAQATFGDPRERTTLFVARDAVAPETGHARYWPASPGWHYVQSGADGAVLAFFVQAPDVLPALRAERRRTATAALVAGAEGAAAPAMKVGHGVPGISEFKWYPLFGYIAFAGFLAAMTVIWSGERRGS